MYVLFIQNICVYVWHMLFLLLRNASKLEICIEVGELEPQEAGESVWTRHIWYGRVWEPENHMCEPHAAEPGHILGCPGDKVN